MNLLHFARRRSKASNSKHLFRHGAVLNCHVEPYHHLHCTDGPFEQCRGKASEGDLVFRKVEGRGSNGVAAQNAVAPGGGGPTMKSCPPACHSTGVCHSSPNEAQTANLQSPPHISTENTSPPPGIWPAGLDPVGTLKTGKKPQSSGVGLSQPKF